MKKRRPTVSVDYTEIFKVLIAQFRHLNKLTIGPLDRLQTREFQHLIQKLQELQGSEDLTDRSLLSAYLMYHWPVHLAEGISLMQELPTMADSVLEIGSGTAPFSLSALMSGATRAATMDTNELALRHGAEICGKLGYPLTVRQNDPKKTTQWPFDDKWDLIVVSHCLEKMFGSMAEQKSFIKSLFSKLTPSGHILIVDSSETAVNRRFLALRDMLVVDGIRVQAPCIWQGACPALAHGKTPCYSQRPFEKHFLINDMQKALGVHGSSLKMTYLLLCHPGQKTTHPEGERLYRVVSPPIETFKGIRHFLCGVDGKKMLGSRLKTHPKQSKAYEFIKKGDLISVKDAIELDDDLVVSEETTLTLRAPFDKPAL